MKINLQNTVAKLHFPADHLTSRPECLCNVCKHDTANILGQNGVLNANKKRIGRITQLQTSWKRWMILLKDFSEKTTCL